METPVDYALSAFPNNTFVAGVLADQIAAVPAVGRRLSFATLTGSTVSLSFPGPVVGAAKTALDGVVAAHLGRPYGPGNQATNAMGQQSNDTTVDAAAVTLVSEPLPSGLYMLNWICEVRPTTNTTGMRVAVQSNISGSFTDHYVEDVDTHVNAGTFWQPFTGSIVATINQVGTTPSVRIVWARTGAVSNPALIRRARLALLSQS